MYTYCFFVIIQCPSWWYIHTLSSLLPTFNTTRVNNIDDQSTIAFASSHLHHLRDSMIALLSLCVHLLRTNLLKMIDHQDQRSSNEISLVISKTNKWDNCKSQNDKWVFLYCWHAWHWDFLHQKYHAHNRYREIYHLMKLSLFTSTLSYSMTRLRYSRNLYVHLSQDSLLNIITSIFYM